MTREEQIIEAGTYCLCGSQPPKTCGHNMHELTYISRNLAFEAGAKWADENPKPGMVNKQEFIAKVRRWLEIETNWNMEYDECGRNDNYGKIDELVKYLEE